LVVTSTTAFVVVVVIVVVVSGAVSLIEDVEISVAVAVAVVVVIVTVTSFCLHVTQQRRGVAAGSAGTSSKPSAPNCVAQFASIAVRFAHSAPAHGSQLSALPVASNHLAKQPVPVPLHA
jgi:hypothetical protein